MSDRFEDIRTFTTVVQAKGFAGAAERLGVAKSAISRRVSDLEDRLGTRLLHRRRGRSASRRPGPISTIAE